MNDHYVSGSVSALVMLAAIGLTFTTYSSYKDEVAIVELENATANMEQAANVILSIKADKAAQAAAVAATTTTTKAKTTSTSSE
jgi:hypothetical protein